MDKRDIEELLTEDIASLGCNLWGVELSGKQLSRTLRVFIDKDNGISIEDCEKVSKHICKVLETENNFERNFVLEVSSPGIKRKFFKENQYASYLKQKLKIRFLEDEGSFVTKRGTLEEIKEEGLLLKSGKEDIYIKFNSIEKANLEN